MNKKDSLSVKTESKKTTVATAAKENLVQKAQVFIDNNRKLVTGISVGIIILTAVFFIAKNRLDKSAEEDRLMASVAISRILPYIQANDFERALYGDPKARVRNQKVIGLVEIIKNYGSTHQAEYAALYAGNCFLNLNKIQDAFKYFDIASDSKAKIIKEGASAGMAYCSEQLGKYKDAADYYEKAEDYSTTTGMKNKYMLFRALCCEKTGDKETAEKLFREIVYDNQSEYVGYAKSGLIRLGTIIE